MGPVWPIAKIAIRRDVAETSVRETTAAAPLLQGSRSGLEIKAKLGLS
jgi:hypothetical protein